jgi:hypothetical protein
MTRTLAEALRTDARNLADSTPSLPLTASSVALLDRSLGLVAVADGAFQAQRRFWWEDVDAALDGVDLELLVELAPETADHATRLRVESEAAWPANDRGVSDADFFNFGG